MLDLLLKAVPVYSLKTAPLKAFEGATLRGPPRSFGSASAIVLWAALEAGRVWGASRRRGFSTSGPACQAHAGQLRGEGEPAGRASRREGCRRGRSPQGVSTPVGALGLKSQAMSVLH